MPSHLPSRLTFAAAVAGLALAAMTSPAWGDPAANAAASLASNVKKALKLGKTADKRSKSALSTARAAKTESAAALAKGGPPGPAGARGLQGPRGLTGAPASTLYAYVDLGDAGAVTPIPPTLKRGRGVVSVARQGTNPGRFFVTFNRDVSDCALSGNQVTTDTSDPIGTPGADRSISLGVGPAEPTTVSVAQFSQTGTPTDGITANTNGDVMIVVMC